MSLIIVRPKGKKFEVLLFAEGTELPIAVFNQADRALKYADRLSDQGEYDCQVQSEIPEAE